MSRSGYTDDCDDNLASGRWRGVVASAIRGKRGQSFLIELLAALDAMPEKRLIAQSFGKAGSYCTLGVIGAARGAVMPVLTDDPDDYYDGDVAEMAGAALNIASPLAAEVMYHNDDWGWNDTPEQRWVRMRAFVAERIKAQP